MRATAIWSELLMVRDRSFSRPSICLCKPTDLSWVTATYSTPQSCPLTSVCVLTHMHNNGNTLKLNFKPIEWETQDSSVELGHKLEEATLGSRSFEVTLSWLLKHPYTGPKLGRLRVYPREEGGSILLSTPELSLNCS